MKRTLILILLTVATACSYAAKTTYIPTYFGHIKLWANGVDTVFVSGITEMTEMFSPDSTIRVSINHEVVDELKVKTIKRSKRAAGWATAAAILNGVSAGLNPGRTPGDAMRYVHQMRMVDASVDFARYASANAAAAQILKVEYKIENISDKEIMIADIARGLIWYVQPHEYLTLEADNPDAAKLRICNADPREDPQIKFVALSAGSFVEKQTIALEDEDYWFYPQYREEISGVGTVNEKTDKILEGYNKRDKETFEEEFLSIDEFKEIKASRKK